MASPDSTEHSPGGPHSGEKEEKKEEKAEEKKEENKEAEKGASGGEDKGGKGATGGDAGGASGTGDKSSGGDGEKRKEGDSDIKRKVTKHVARGGGRRGKGGVPRRGIRGQPKGGGGGPVRVRLPRHRSGEIFGIAETLLGGSRINVMCEDGKSRMGRIPGKMKKREWIREGDLVIIKPWSFQDEKADVVWRYTKNQALNLARKRLIPKSIDIYS